MLTLKSFKIAISFFIDTSNAFQQFSAGFRSLKTIVSTMQDVIHKVLCRFSQKLFSTFKSHVELSIQL